jgi:hypothetical protein
LDGKYGDDFGRVKSALVRLAKSCKPKERAEIAFRLS